MATEREDRPLEFLKEVVELIKKNDYGTAAKKVLDASKSERSKFDHLIRGAKESDGEELRRKYLSDKTRINAFVTTYKDLKMQSDDNTEDTIDTSETSQSNVEQTPPQSPSQNIHQNNYDLIEQIAKTRVNQENKPMQEEPKNFFKANGQLGILNEAIGKFKPRNFNPEPKYKVKLANQSHAEILKLLNSIKTKVNYTIPATAFPDVKGQKAINNRQTILDQLPKAKDFLLSIVDAAIAKYTKFSTDNTNEEKFYIDEYTAGETFKKLTPVEILSLKLILYCQQKHIGGNKQEKGVLKDTELGKKLTGNSSGDATVRLKEKSDELSSFEKEEFGKDATGVAFKPIHNVNERRNLLKFLIASTWEKAGKFIDRHIEAGICGYILLKRFPKSIFQNLLFFCYGSLKGREAYGFYHYSVSNTALMQKKVKKYHSINDMPDRVFNQYGMISLD